MLVADPPESTGLAGGTVDFEQVGTLGPIMVSYHQYHQYYSILCVQNTARGCGNRPLGAAGGVASPT